MMTRLVLEEGRGVSTRISGVSSGSTLTQSVLGGVAGGVGGITGAEEQLFLAGVISGLLLLSCVSCF